MLVMPPSRRQGDVGDEAVRDQEYGHRDERGPELRAASGVGVGRIVGHAAFQHRLARHVKEYRSRVSPDRRQMREVAGPDLKGLGGR